MPSTGRQVHGVAHLVRAELQHQLDLAPGRGAKKISLSEEVGTCSLHREHGTGVGMRVLQHEPYSDGVIGVDEIVEVEVGIRVSAPRECAGHDGLLFVSKFGKRNLVAVVSATSLPGPNAEPSGAEQACPCHRAQRCTILLKPPAGPARSRWRGTTGLLVV